MSRLDLLRGAGAILLILHGIMHWPGFAVPWKLLTLRAIPYTTTIVGDTVSVGDTGIQVFGLLWLATIVFFVVAGLGIWRKSSWSVPLTVAAAALSLVLSLANRPMAWEGVVIDLAILAAVAVLITRPTRRRAHL